VGILDAGRLNPEKLARILDGVEGLTELVCHPGINDAALEAVYGWGYGWDRETAALCDPGIRQELAARGIEVRGFTPPGIEIPGY
jgi:predicted glycoside hydrolase/deacetylase ChbG (UPF0249 family)